MNEEYYTVKEVADRFRVSRQAVYDWITQGQLKAIKVGNRTRIPTSAIDAFVRPIQVGEIVETEDEE